MGMVRTNGRTTSTNGAFPLLDARKRAGCTAAVAQRLTFGDLQQMNCVADHEELPEISQYVQPSKLTRAQRRLWLLESIRANMLYYATEIECRAMRGRSLPCDGIAPAFATCNELWDSVLEEVDKIRATYDKDWVTNQLRTRPNRDLSSPESGIYHHKDCGYTTQTAPRIGRNVQFSRPNSWAPAGARPPV